MLVFLSIRDVVLIDRLDLAFDSGLGVLTGETGAGKSILLDSLGLALGARAESGLVRRGAAQLSVSARFDPPSDHAVWDILREQGLETEDESLILRRVLSADGRSRAFVNDQPCSVGLLRRVGEYLVEVHGQFESHGLLNPAGHRAVLDAHGGLAPQREAVRAAFHAWRERARARAEAEADLEAARAEEDFIRHTLDELQALAPHSDEEETLAARRNALMHAEKVLAGMNAGLAALTQPMEAESALRTAMRHLTQIADKADGKLDPVIEALDRAAVEIAEACGQLEHAASGIDLDPKRLEQVEERLFALRAQARKHGCAVADLPALMDRLRARLDAVEAGNDRIAALIRAERDAREAYLNEARALSRARVEAAKRLDAAVAAELPPLKLERAVFTTTVEPLEENAWGEHGLDRVAFLVATNPGAPPGPIGKIASGGELARFMLALKVVLAGSSDTPTLVFDEVDSGIGGATAAAVGARLARLAERLQVLVVTHSPQVAARGAHHYRVDKRSLPSGETATTVLALSGAERREEVARMLAGARVTDEARAAADSLLAPHPA